MIQNPKFLEPGGTRSTRFKLNAVYFCVSKTLKGIHTYRYYEQIKFSEFLLFLCPAFSVFSFAV